MRTSLLVVMAATAIFVVATPAMARAKVGWSTSLRGGFSRPIPDINDPHVQELGSWAVSEHVKTANDGLRFNRVVSGKVRVVEAFLYDLIVDTTDSNGRNTKYEAEVWEKEWVNFRQLSSFKPAN